MLVFCSRAGYLALQYCSKVCNCDFSIESGFYLVPTSMTDRENSLRQRKTPALPAKAMTNQPSVAGANSSNSHYFRPDKLPYNTFRASHGSDVEGLLLFPEQPRQIFVLCVVVAGFSYFSFTHESHNTGQNVRNALFAAILVFLVYCFLQTRDGLMMRPHPGVWRVVHGCSVVYLLLLAAMLVQNRQGAINAMQVLLPEIGSRPKTVIAVQVQCDINAAVILIFFTKKWVEVSIVRYVWIH